MEDWQVVAAAGRFALLADPTRLRILHTVLDGGELSVGAIAAAAGASRYNTSAHLSRLAAGGVVVRRREGSTVYYRVGDDRMARICDLMCDAVQQRRTQGA